MSRIVKRWPIRFDHRHRLQVILRALGVCIGGFLAGLIGILVVRPILPRTVTQMDAFSVVAGNLIQIGFAVFAIVYLLFQDNRERYVKVRSPTVEDLGWIVTIPLLLIAGSFVLSPVLTALGLPEPMPGGGGESLDLTQRPELWPVAFVGLYLFAAPAEELVYRGILQGKLRGSFGTVGVAAIGGLLFGFMHLIVGLVTPAVGIGGSVYWGISAVVPGLVWGYAYERTENLLVTAVTHAMSWTIPFHSLLALL